MLLKYPEMLWGLLLLIIPVLIHLLRLRRYRKTPFTNVRLLERLVVEANRSSQLKKWLLLISRLGLIASLVLAFAQPFTAQENADAEREIVIYLDNSFSMQAPENRAGLLQNAIQELLQQLPTDFECGLLTNTEQYSRRNLNALRDKLLNPEYTHEQPDMASLLLRARNLFSRDPGTLKELWMISDFQRLEFSDQDSAGAPGIHVVPVRPGERYNVSVDTAYVRNRSAEILELQVGIRLDDPDRNKPLSLYNGDTLLAKTSAELNEDGTGSALFSLPAGQNIQGVIRVLDEGLAYDNNLYFNLEQPPRIRVFSLGPGPRDYLSRIFTEDEFEFRSSSLQEADYALLETQHLVILNEVPEIPAPLVNRLVSFVRDGGNLVVIPATEIPGANYNGLLRPLGLTLGARQNSRNLITEIAFDHPLYRDVFEGKVTNFEYPSVESYYTLPGAGPGILNFQNGAPFLSARGQFYLFSAALNPGNSNFRQSPLIVPTLYAIGRRSLPFPDLYYTIGTDAQLELDERLAADRIFELRGPDYEFIPRQQAFARKTRLYFSEEPRKDGNFRVYQEERPYRFVSFNYPRTESPGTYPELDFPEFVQVHPDSGALIGRYQNDTRITALWKWFVILALLFVLAEAILQKIIR